MVMIMLFRETSVASFAGLAIMLLLVPIQVRAAMHCKESLQQALTRTTLLSSSRSNLHDGLEPSSCVL